jgi:hypothetical protein
MSRKSYQLCGGGFVRFASDEVQAIRRVGSSGLSDAGFDVTLTNGKTYRLLGSYYRQVMKSTFGCVSPHRG